jgi:hypothetical protein
MGFHVSCAKMQFVSATPNKFIEWKLLLLKYKKSGVWWSFDEAVFPVSASYAIRHFINFIIIIIIIIIINCNWVVTLWQWLFYMYTKYEIGYY